MIFQPYEVLRQKGKAEDFFAFRPFSRKSIPEKASVAAILLGAPVR
jgi:hypothetical protein